MADPVQPADDPARALARAILRDARHGALATLDPQTGGPLASRVACALDGADLLLLVSDLSQHAAALRADPRCALLLGEAGPKGDPLAHPRLSLNAVAVPEGKPARRGAWLRAHPKAALYVDFADFRMLRLAPRPSFLNGGFGRAHRMTPDDLGLRGDQAARRPPLTCR
ncbi:hypothetical protein BCF33_1817 [Hasllibacter halocynthiae]|uniref:Pyridoxamine 5'-phosphate oxidase N-terminal domain-containing protein n=1 Tax=Hasllibacter halocynthiae TaxID=595589 RepID=A0A2T0X1X2_9RHOB|nr:pyridoxamine 5'-phosphate oxidase family protein [Hasllibacter halocynthiae]PRY92953.1 hypothetical protein BCF33_1817 [Hasllibacter halocynthiae]